MNETQTYRPSLNIYHSSQKGTGSVARFEVQPAHGDSEGAVWMTLANQLTIGTRQGTKPSYPHYDWENKVCVKLDFNDLCQLLQVLRGERESIGEGKGLYHQTAKTTTRIVFRHFVEPCSAYSLEIYRNLRNGGDEVRVHIVFSSAEAMGLCEAIAGSMAVICFGIPNVVPRDSISCEYSEKGARDVIPA